MKAAAVAVVALAIATGALADVVETKSGAKLVGKIVGINAGSIAMDTDYAGALTIKQSEVASFSTDQPVSVRLASGTRMDGRVSGATDGALQIVGADGTITTTVSKVAATWAAGGKDPAVVALERHWSYEAAVDVTGKTGNSEQLGTAASVRATLKTPQDTLQFYSAYDRQVADKVKAADQFKAGVDYQNNFHGQLSWYSRDEGGFDRVKNIQLYNVAAFGMGYDLIKEPKHVLTTRLGLAYRYEGYTDNTKPAVSSAGLDFGVNHEFTFQNAKLVNRLTIVPTFQDFANYRLNHESFFEIPLVAPFWKVRLGVSNDYNSKPIPGVKRLDTIYFTRLVLDWE